MRAVLMGSMAVAALLAAACQSMGGAAQVSATSPNIVAAVADKARPNDAAFDASCIGQANACAGVKLDAFRTGSSAEGRKLIDKIYVRLVDAQFNLGKPSIAAVTGAARGAGMTLAISCDLIVAADSATFGYPEIDVGLVPAIHFTHLPRIVGRYRAFELLFTGRTFDAQEAQSLGLVNRVAPADTELDEARTLARMLADKSPELMRIGKAAFMNAIDSDYRRGVAGAVELVCAVSSTEAFREGMAAFVEKRKPVWKDD